VPGQSTGMGWMSSNTHQSSPRHMAACNSWPLPGPPTLGSKSRAVSCCRGLLQPPRTHPNPPSHGCWSHPFGHVFQPACPHPSLPMLPSLSTGDKQGISSGMGPARGMQDQVFSRKTSSGSRCAAPLGFSGSEAAPVVKAPWLHQRHPARKIGTGLAALWRRSPRNPLALARVSPHVTKPLCLRDGFGLRFGQPLLPGGRAPRPCLQPPPHLFPSSAGSPQPVQPPLSFSPALSSSPSCFSSTPFQKTTSSPPHPTPPDASG